MPKPLYDAHVRAWRLTMIAFHEPLDRGARLAIELCEYGFKAVGGLVSLTVVSYAYRVTGAWQLLPLMSLLIGALWLYSAAVLVRMGLAVSEFRFSYTVTRAAQVAAVIVVSIMVWALQTVATDTTVLMDAIARSLHPH